VAARLQLGDKTPPQLDSVPFNTRLPEGLTLSPNQIVASPPATAISGTPVIGSSRRLVPIESDGWIY